MKKFIIILLCLFLLGNGKAALALEINSGDYGKNTKLVKTLKEKIKKLHIYGHLELVGIEFRKNNKGLCGFILKYDKPIKLGRSEYIQTSEKGLEECTEELLNFIRRLNYFYAFKELQILGTEINGERVNISGENKNGFPTAVVGEFTVFVVLAENEFEFFIADGENHDDIFYYASTIEEVKKFLLENIPQIIRENHDEDEEDDYFVSKQSNLKEEDDDETLLPNACFNRSG